MTIGYNPRFGELSAEQRAVVGPKEGMPGGALAADGGAVRLAPGRVETGVPPLAPPDGTDEHAAEEMWMWDTQVPTRLTLIGSLFFLQATLLHN